MSKYGIAHSHASISKRMVPLLAHHQMLCYCRLHNYSVVLQTQTLGKTRAWLRKTIVASIVIVFVDMMAEISARSSVSSLRSSSVQLDPRSLLGLTTLVPAFLDSSKRGSYT